MNKMYILNRPPVHPSPFPPLPFRLPPPASPFPVANFDPDTFSVMRCEFCSAGFDTRAGLSSHARAHLRDFGITNWEVTVSPIHILRGLFSSRPDLALPTAPPRSPGTREEDEEEGGERRRAAPESSLVSLPPPQAWRAEPPRKHEIGRAHV